MPLIQTRQLSKTFKNGDAEITVLHSLDLEVGQGETVALIGHSGAGKTTLMHLLGCLDVPNAGQYLLDGQDVTSLPKNHLPYIRNQKIGFIFQHFHLLPDLTALENVILPQLYGGLPQAQARERAQMLLELVGLSARLSYLPQQLSGGQKQRVAIARALAMNPKILLADEPTGNLDAENTQLILELFNTINTQHQTTLIVVTHSIEVAHCMRRCITLHQGNIITDQYQS